MTQAVEGEGSAGGAAPRSSSQDMPLPQWVRITTHLVALGGFVAEVGFLGARLTSLSFITTVLLADHGPALALRLRRALAGGAT